LGTIATLEVLQPGPLTTVQDLGRYGFGRYGVPPSGALDAYALRTANLLVGNPEGEAVLEITLMGLKVRALVGCVVAVGGGDLRPVINEGVVETWRSYVMHRDDILHFKGPKTGCRAYLAVGGGIASQPVLGSKSTNLSSGFGGHEGRPLRKGDVLFSDSSKDFLNRGGRTLPLEWIPVYRKDRALKVLFGPQDCDFPEESKDTLLNSTFRVSPHSDRTGIRLSGPPILRKQGTGESIISEGVVPGTIQIPGDAQPIIILSETITGGYRKIATVISADLPMLGQVKPGDQIRFRQVTLVDALKALEEMEGRIRVLRERLSGISP
jgi:antagonist of KipI